MPECAPRVIVFAGPNGAGKTTHAEPILQTLGIDTFVNADFIARGLAGRHAESVAFEAGRLMLRRLKQLAAQGQDFAFESTLASRSFAPFLARLKAQGYVVAIYYFSLRSAALALKRVRLRVRLGGHGVPDETVRRRFHRSLANFMSLYQPLADEWTVFENSTDGVARLIAQNAVNGTLIKDEEIWLRIQHLALAANARS